MAPHKSRSTAYADGGTSLTGELFAHEDPRPGILLVHGGAGLDDHTRGQARRYAALGYSVFACDMFGDGVAGSRERIVACLTQLRDDPQLMVRRAQAGLAEMCRSSGVDSTRTAAIGFCFGGMVALALARSGESIAGAISIHGSLATSMRAGPGAVRARVLVCHGAADPHVPLPDVTAFATEMADAGADWQLNMYGGAQHGFTHSDAVPGAVAGVAYDSRADTRSFADARDFLAEVLGLPAGYSARIPSKYRLSGIGCCRPQAETR